MGWWKTDKQRGDDFAERTGQVLVAWSEALDAVDDLGLPEFCMTKFGRWVAVIPSWIYLLYEFAPTRARRRATRYCCQHPDFAKALQVTVETILDAEQNEEDQEDDSDDVEYSPDDDREPESEPTKAIRRLLRGVGIR